MNNDNNNRYVNQTKYAWSQYFRSIRENAEVVQDILGDIGHDVFFYHDNTNDKEEKIPQHVVNTLKGLLDKYKHYTECAICMEAFEGSEDVDVLIRCGHMFCKQCLELHKMSEDRPKCPVCRKRI